MQEDMWLRLLCAMVAGAALGLERESHGRAAGLRTNVLVCVAPCIGMILSEWFYRGAFMDGNPAGWRPDPARIAAGILAGMGFIGGGVILKQGDLVRGVTTASVLWLASFIGMSFGAGLYGLGFAGLAFGLVTLLGLPFVERKVQVDWYSVLTLVSKAPEISAAAVSAVLEKHDVHIKQVNVEFDAVAGLKTMIFRVRYKKRDLIHLSEQLVSDLAALPGVQRVSYR